LSPLEPEQCKDVSEKGKTKSLIEAYKIAAEGHDLQHFKDMLMQHEAALQEDEDRKAQREAEKAAKADKKKRKSEVKADDVDMEDADDTAPKKSSKKRKKDAESDDEEPEKVSDLCSCDINQLIATNSLQRPQRPRSSSLLLVKLLPQTRKPPKRRPPNPRRTRKRRQ